ncbi:MAG TPA: SLBB domain-containing protein, partial [Treponemataceae bacterium]|nr:SLBB domain-containing protein [Treponemataceae bacterium]
EHVVNASLAMSNPDYMVTAGDVYQLAYAAGSTAVTYPIIIDTTYKMRVANLSVIDVSGKTFTEVKAQVEQIITRNYPMSGLQFTLEKPASFMVMVDGEVSTAGEKKAWALTRLSDVVGSFYTAYSSTRTVTVTSSSGKKKVYDLFDAKRNGNLAQNPYVRPGDHITIQRAERKVTIDGAVERPGSYELLEGENLKELVEKYASGLTLFADVNRIELTRYNGSMNEVGDKYFYKEEAITSNIALNDHDSISIMSLQDLIPVMFMEGAVFQSTALDDARLDRTELAAPEDTANRVTVRFIEGENYGSLVRRNRNLLTAASDTQKASIIRKGVIIPFDINPLLYDSNYYTDEIVQPYDVLLIPFRQYFVIDGEVTSTGEIEAKGLTRLASVVRPYFTPYSSSRNILVTSASGTIHTYDLFEAERNGDFSQNPYLSPGDRITVQRAERTVTIGGAVERPGTYELLEGENLKELIEIYASGLTVFADSS